MANPAMAKRFPYGGDHDATSSPAAFSVTLTRDAAPSSTVNVAVFTVIYLVVFIAFAMAGIVPVMAVFYPLPIALVASISNALFYTRGGKFGLVAIEGALLGLILFLMGMGGPLGVLSQVEVICTVHRRLRPCRTPQLPGCSYGSYTAWTGNGQRHGGGQASLSVPKPRTHGISRSTFGPETRSRPSALTCSGAVGLNGFYRAGWAVLFEGPGSEGCAYDARFKRAGRQGRLGALPCSVLAPSGEHRRTPSAALLPQRRRRRHA